MLENNSTPLNTIAMRHIPTDPLLSLPKYDSLHYNSCTFIVLFNNILHLQFDKLPQKLKMKSIFLNGLNNFTFSIRIQKTMQMQLLMKKLRITQMHSFKNSIQQ